MEEGLHEPETQPCGDGVPAAGVSTTEGRPMGLIPGALLGELLPLELATTVRVRTVQWACRQGQAAAWKAQAPPAHSLPLLLLAGPVLGCWQSRNMACKSPNPVSRSGPGMGAWKLGLSSLTTSPVQASSLRKF